MNPWTCPFCTGSKLEPVAGTLDLECNTCTRVWYETQIDGETTIASRPRAVSVRALPAEGDDYGATIIPNQIIWVRDDEFPEINERHTTNPL